MGRGRAKAKQTKVARQLKYGGPRTDLSALEAELSGRSDHVFDEVEEPVEEFGVDPYAEDPYEDDPYAKYYEDDDDEDDAPADGHASK